MKNLILLSIALCLFGSCAKRGCTNPFSYNYDASVSQDDGSCIDLTQSIIGTYSGTFEVQDIATGNSQSAVQQISVTKIDDSHIAIYGGDMPFIKVLVKPATNGDLLLVIDAQVWSGTSINPYIIYSADGQPCSGGYTSAAREISIIAITDGASIIAFQGTH